METELQRANNLNEQIKDLEHFLYTVTRYIEPISVIPSVTVIMNQTVVKEVSFFGSRFFGCGTHEQSIKVPNTVRNDLINLAEKRLSELKSEYQSIFTTPLNSRTNEWYTLYLD